MGGGDARGPYDELASLYLPIAATVFALVALALVVPASRPVRFRLTSPMAPDRAKALAAAAQRKRDGALTHARTA